MQRGASRVLGRKVKLPDPEAYVRRMVFDEAKSILGIGNRPSGPKVSVHVRVTVNRFAEMRYRCQKAVNEALEVVAEEIAEHARRRAPVLSGELRDSIHVTLRGRSLAVVAGAPYAAHVEFGTIDTPTQPFMRPAVTKGRKMLVSEVKKRMPK